MHGQVKFTLFSSYYFPSFLVIYLLLSPPRLSRHYYLAQRYKFICPISSHSINIMVITKLYVSRPKNEFNPLTARLHIYRSSAEMRAKTWEMSFVCVFGNLKQAETYFCPGTVVLWILMLFSLFTTPCLVLNCWRCGRPICKALGCHSAREFWAHRENSAQEFRIKGPFTFLVSFTKIVSRSVNTFVKPVTTNVKNDNEGEGCTW